MSDLRVVIFSAPSGSGKSTIINGLMKRLPNTFEFSISATSRAPRGTEQNGKEYYFLTPDTRVQTLGIKVLRIELIAEPLFGASIVASGALRGAEDTLVPGIMTLVSIWGVRLTLGALLSSKLGLTGIWIAMCVELCFRGLLMLIRLATSPYLKK